MVCDIFYVDWRLKKVTWRCWEGKRRSFRCRKSWKKGRSRADDCENRCCSPKPYKKLKCVILDRRQMMIVGKLFRVVEEGADTLQSVESESQV